MRDLNFLFGEKPRVIFLMYTHLNSNVFLRQLPDNQNFKYFRFDSVRSA
jgi:hypothetical protein